MARGRRRTKRRGRPAGLKIRQKNEVLASFAAWLQKRATEHRLKPDVVMRSLRRRGSSVIEVGLRARLQREFRDWFTAQAIRNEVSHMTIRRCVWGQGADAAAPTAEEELLAS